MIRFLFRLLGQIVLAVALVFAVADIARSLANDETSLTTLGDAAASVHLSMMPSTGASDRTIDVVALVSAWPAAVVLAGLAFLLLFIGRRPRLAPGRRGR